MIDLAQSRLGTKIIYKTDEFFAPAKRIINPWPPVFKEGVFDKHGKWMDGWETRRKRGKGYDYLILKLGRPGRISKVDIDTSYFSGNQPLNLRGFLAEIEEKLISAAMQQSDGSLELAAEKLGLTPEDLLEKIKVFAVVNRTYKG